MAKRGPKRETMTKPMKAATDGQDGKASQEGMYISFPFALLQVKNLAIISYTSNLHMI